MKFGTAIRHRLGAPEPYVADGYRTRLINLDDLAMTVASFADPHRIVEIGCGDRAVADRLCRESPEVEYLGVDIAPSPRRLFRGNGRAELRSQGSSALLASNPEPFDLALLVDVFHHLPDSARLPTLRDLDALTAPGGLIIIKDWDRSTTLGHLACYVSTDTSTGTRVWVT